eukprot:TRINITY_DN5213_c0_g1_i1.p1 TRINITY_DN5213_c0_g1~~TRINITY_DN5213_c0_g1_i1.p1  ORF type:complete len:476 (-),score=15.60 TRINITY_DN5213_c0_g1_i1:101-1528(-)
MERRLKIKTCSMIKPSVPTQCERLFLSNFDFLFLFINNVKRVLFYSLSPPSEASAEEFKEDVITNLKESLSQALVKFYPLAGRLHKSHDDRYEIDCNDEGVAFVEAESDVDFKDLQKEEFAYRELFKDLVRHHGDANAPLLSVQVTFFKAFRGMSIGATLRHVVADGRSFWNFMKSWSRICRRSRSFYQNEAESNNNGEEDEPCHHRHALQFPNPTAEDVTFCFRDSKTGKGKLFTFTATSDTVKQSESSNKKIEKQNKTAVEEAETSTKRFHFGEQDLARLKAKAGSRTSSFVALSAHFWRSVVRSRELSPEDSVAFAVLADIRERLKPAFPKTFFGNCITFGLVVTTAGDLLEEEDDMSLAVELVKEAVETSVEEEYLKLFNRWLQSPQKLVEAFTSQSMPRQAVNVVSSPRFEVYETDFGWGRPETVQASDYDNLGCMMLFRGRDNPRSIDVWTRLHSQQMRSLSSYMYQFL